jgi:Sulfotransferase domain
MRLASAGGISFYELQMFRLFRLRKRIRQFFFFKPGMDKTVVFIVGCQRSGTTMIHHLFRLDPDTVTYDEVSPLSSEDPEEQLRLNPLAQVKAQIQADRAPLIITKPLVESQNLFPLLDLFPDTKAIWMYRHYCDVASSNLKFFSQENGFTDLHPILKRSAGNWRSQNMAEIDIRAIESVYSDNMDPHDAAALFWYARNSLFFSRKYVDDPRIALCCYGEMVTKPDQIMRQAYDFIGHEYPGDKIVKDVFSRSRGKGRNIPLSPGVRQLCEEMWDRLNSAKNHHGFRS